MFTADGRQDLPLSFTRLLQSMLDIEVALAEAVAEVGLIPTASVPLIRNAARLEGFDARALADEARSAGNVVIPLVRHLRQRVGAQDTTAAGHVHWGATSQDIHDTAVVVQLRLALAEMDQSLTRAADSAADLAHRHADVPIAARTWLQQATPTTFGAKAAVWLDGLERVRARLNAAGDAAAVVQLGGAVGTQASFGEHGPAVAAALARALGLGVAEVTWHTERSRLVDVACAMGLVCGTAGKIGRDVALMAQTEVGEVAEGSSEGRGGSSSMPHKRNPVSAASAIAASLQAPGLVATMLSAMPQEHERALGGWQVEWNTLPALTALTMTATRDTGEMLQQLLVHAAQMRANLDAHDVARAEGLVIVLAPRLGRAEAHRVVEAACRAAIDGRRTLADVASRDPAIASHLDRDALARALDPAEFVPSARALVERALRTWRPQMAKERVDGR